MARQQLVKRTHILAYNPTFWRITLVPAVCPGYSGSRVPLHLGRRGDRRLGGCRRHASRNHEDTRTPRRT